MRLTTTSEVIRFATELEGRNQDFYNLLAERYPEAKEVFSVMARESKKNKVLVQRTYNEVVTDAIETAYSFDQLDVDEDMGAAILPDGLSISDAVAVAGQVEEDIIIFYLTSAEMSRGLLADLPPVFERITRKRKERKRKLASLGE